MTPREVIAAKLPTKLNENWADEIIAALTAAGYVILPAAEVEAKDKALEPFALIADDYAVEEEDEFQVWNDFDVLGASLPLRIFRSARRALKGEKP